MLETLTQPERLLSVKSKFDAEFRRFAISTGKTQYDEFKDKVRDSIYADVKVLLGAENSQTRLY